ncbi:MAG: S9 family peptidase, partial [Bryobacteraceae bacterium]|nr:S9 family peptidase [Bryobacteraceae bacterium]
MKWFASAALVLSLPFVFGGTKPITHEELWAMKRVDAPHASPDGKWVVVSVTEPSYDESAVVSDLWISPADGSAPPRRLTNTKGGESGMEWSPDSRRIAFSAKREGDETAQIYILDLLGGGEATRVTSLSTGASGPKFSPDGKSILFQSSVFPGTTDDESNRKAAADRKAQKYKARVYEGFPIRHWDKWLDDTVRHIFVQNLSDGSKPKDLLATTKLVTMPGFSGTQTNSGQDLQPVWTPDGRGVVFVASTNRNESAYREVRFHLWQVASDGGEPVALTQGGGEYGMPGFRPDGKALYASEEKHEGKIYGLIRIAMWSWPMTPGSAPAVITSSFDRSVNGFDFTPDSKTIYLTAEDATHEKLYTMPAGGGAVKPVGDFRLGCYSNLTMGGGSLFANFDSASNPPEVVRIDAKTGEWNRLTSFNVERATALDLPPMRHFETSVHGKKVHSMMALPPGFSESKKYPLFVVIHGGAHAMWRDQWVTRWNYHLLAKPGYVVLLTDYTGSTGYGEKFALDITGDPLKGPAEEINAAADEAIRRFPFIDGARQAAGGASYGGHLTNWLQATTTRYKCLISHAGLIDLGSQWGTSDGIYHRELTAGSPLWERNKIWTEQSPITYAANFKTPMLVTVGENDFRV